MAPANVVYSGKYIKIVTAVPASKNRKTPIYAVLPDGVAPENLPVRIGQIRWWTAWRCFTFWPESNTLYERHCLVDITKFLDALAADRKAKTPYPQ